MPNPDTITVEYTTSSGQRCRVVFESRWPDRGYRRREEVRRGCSWEPVGEEPVADLVVDGAVEDIGRTHFGP